MKQIRIETLSKHFGRGGSTVCALDGIDLTIRPGEFFFLLGPSGCGKTTLLRILAGMLDADDGAVWFDNQNVSDWPAEQRSAAMVFQNYALWPHMTVGQNVEFAPRMQGAGRSQRKQRAAAQLKRVQLEGYHRRKPNQLSGGQQQRVALARALAAETGILLLDEPLSNLDARLRADMRTELRQLVKSSNATAVYVTHDQKEALAMADRMAVMREGQLVQVGTPEEIYHRPCNRFVAGFIGEANFFTGKVTHFGAGGPTRIESPAGAIRVTDQTEQTRPVASEVTCCVRPEWIHLVSAGSDVPAHVSALPATIVSELYLGEVRQFTCRLSDGSHWRVAVLGPSGGAFQLGQSVDLHLREDDLCILGKS